MGKNKFAQRLVEVLNLKGISQRAFAKQIKFDQTTVNGWCVGKHEPSIDVLLLIAEELRESIDWLVGLVD
jgi:transcriptional regulator with XRE-family HTH domain